jgi:hypothetical protein
VHIGQSHRSEVDFFHRPGDGRGDLRPVLTFRDATNNKMVDHLKIIHKDTCFTLMATRTNNIIEKVIRQYGVRVPGLALRNANISGKPSEFCSVKYFECFSFSFRFIFQIGRPTGTR